MKIETIDRNFRAATVGDLDFQFTDVRQGKRFVLSVDGEVTEAHMAQAREAAETLLSNPVIEDVVSVHELTSDEPEQAPITGAGA